MKWTTILLLVSLATGPMQLACAGNQPPVLTPIQANALTTGLSVLARVLQAKGTAPWIMDLVSGAQVALAADISGKSWGGIARDLVTNLYQDLPAATQNDPYVWGALVAIELALASIGA